MALILPYRLYNKVPADSTIFATLVFVQNIQSTSPVKRVSSSGAGNGNEPAAARFEYLPWQVLSPSAGAYESFTYTDELFLVARFAPDANHEQPAVSAKTRVYGGQTLVLTRQDDTVSIAREKTIQDGPITVRNANEPGPGVSAQLDWYLGDPQVGRILNLAPGATGQFQLGEHLYFLPFPATDMPQQSYCPATVEALQSYQPPLYASSDAGVRVYFALPTNTNEHNSVQGRDYVFCPPSKDWRPAKAGNPSPCRRFEGPTSGSQD
jgi:hypothetical protein